MEKEHARENIMNYIKQCGYTHTVEGLIDSYLKYYKKGYYVSFTTKDCIKNLESELETLTA